eukprot:2845217-Prymnesium_polylepis.1
MGAANPDALDLLRKHVGSPDLSSLKAVVCHALDAFDAGGQLEWNPQASDAQVPPCAFRELSAAQQAPSPAACSAHGALNLS